MARTSRCCEGDLDNFSGLIQHVLLQGSAGSDCLGVARVIVRLLGVKVRTWGCFPLAAYVAAKSQNAQRETPPDPPVSGRSGAGLRGDGPGGQDAGRHRGRGSAP